VPKAFAETVLFPHELELETAGKLTRATKNALRRAVVEHGFHGINHAREVGGQGCTQMQQTLINEELGKATGRVVGRRLASGRAVEARHAGADPRLPDAELPRPPARLRRRDRARHRVGHEPHQDEGDAARRPLRHRRREVVRDERRRSRLRHRHAIVDGDPALPTLFLVDRDTPGLSIKREPKFTHTYVFGHPEFQFNGVEVGADRVLGGVGQGLELTKDWFVEARLQIAANCLGAAIRAFELANDWATKRVQFGAPIRRHQAIEFMLADMAVEIMAAKSMIYRVAWEIDQGIDRKVAHAAGERDQAACVRDGGTRARQGGADLRRARLHARKRGRALESRRARRPDLGRHVGDPADDHRRPARQARHRSFHRLVSGAGT
jgi:alkylation response protein AidB-like acyl-CoA dehydrogenase